MFLNCTGIAGNSFSHLIVNIEDNKDIALIVMTEML